MAYNAAGGGLFPPSQASRIDRRRRAELRNDVWNSAVPAGDAAGVASPCRARNDCALCRRRADSQPADAAAAAVDQRRDLDSRPAMSRRFSPGLRLASKNFRNPRGGLAETGPVARVASGVIGVHDPAPGIRYPYGRGQVGPQFPQAGVQVPPQGLLLLLRSR